MPIDNFKTSGFRFFQAHNGMTWSICLLRIFFRGNWSKLYILIFQNFTGKFIPRAAVFIRQLINAIFTMMVNQIHHKFCQRPSPSRAANLIINYCLSPMVWSDSKAPLSETTLRPSFSGAGFTLSAIFMATFARQTAVMSSVSLKRFARPRISPRPVKSSTTSSSTGRSVISGLSSWLS